MSIGPISGRPEAGSGDAPGRRRRSWRRRLLIGANVTLVLCIVGAAIGYGYLHYRLNQIKKVNVAGETQAGGGQPLNILVTGSDSRAGESAAAATHFGTQAQAAGQRSDVILLVHIDPRTDSASMLSIPRDTQVTLAGGTTQAKINVAFDRGPTQLVQTISDTFGIQINHVVQVTFTGVQDIDNAVGGVCMTFPYPARDSSPSGYGNESGLSIPTAGPHVLNGDQALALIRSRYYNYYKNGAWVSEGTGDLGRIVRQHSFLRALASKTLHKAVTNPLAANSLAGDAVHDVTLDQSFGSNDILRLLTEMRSLRPSTIPSWTLPTRPSTDHLGAVELPEPAQDQAVIQQWQTYDANPSKAPGGGASSSSSTTLAPGSITVAVRNGSGQRGQAALAAGDLRAAGFAVSDTGDASSFTHNSTVVAYGTGGQAKADSLAGAVTGGATVQPDSSLAPGAVELITGSAFQGIAPGGSHTTTTTGAASAHPGAGDNSTVPPWDPTPCPA